MIKRITFIYQNFKEGIVFTFQVYSLKVFLIFFTGWLLFYLFPFGVFNDYLNLNFKISSGVFNGIILNFSSIIGIIVTLLILVLGLLRERLKRFALEEFLQNKHIKILITLTLSVFLFNILSLLIINKENIRGCDLNLAYFSILCSILYLLALFPLLFKAIETVNPREIVIKRVSALKQEDFPEKQVIHFENIDDNPILILRNLLTTSYHDNDISLVNLILYNVTFKTCDLIIENKDDEAKIGRLIEGLLVIWKEYSGNAIRNKDSSNLNRIFECLEYMHVHFSKNKIHLRILNDFDFYIKNLLSKIIEEKNFEPIHEIAFLIERILTYHYENSTPQEGELTSLRHIFGESYFKTYPAMRDYIFGGFRDPHIELNIQWEKISEEIPYYFNIILNESIKNRQTNTFFVIFHTLHSLQVEVLRSSLGKFQKRQIISSLQNNYFYYQIKAIESNLISQPIEVYLPNIDLVSDAIDYKQPFVVTIIKKDFDFLVELNKLKMLDFSSHPVVYCGAIGRHCMVNIEKDRFYRQCMFLIISEIKRLKDFLGKEDHNKENIEELLAQVNSFIDAYNKDFSMTEPKKEKGEINEENVILMHRIKDLIMSFAVERSTTLDGAV